MNVQDSSRGIQKFKGLAAGNEASSSQNRTGLTSDTVSFGNSTQALQTYSPTDFKRSELQVRLDRLFREAKDSPNPVLKSMEPIIRNAKHIEIDFDALKNCAKNLPTEEVEIVDWKFPPYKPENDDKTVDFFMLMNSINFLFFDPANGEKYKVSNAEKEFKGANGMVTSLTRAMDEGVPLLDANFLESVDREKMAHIFRGNIELPLLDERTQIFNEVGRVLNEKYDGSFRNLVAASGGKAFNNGNGMVERLVRDFPSFRDTSPLPDGKSATFNKRAQLAVAMLTSRMAGDDSFECQDVDQLTVFADYQLPRGLRAKGILKYDDELGKKVDNGEEIARDSEMELELRAFTVVAGKLLQNELQKRRELKGMDARGLDAYLWLQGRQDPNSRPHVTVTTTY